MSDTEFAVLAFVAVMIVGGFGVHPLVKVVRKTVKVPPDLSG